MATRKELIAAVAARYRGSGKADRRKILDEFVELTGYRRKHAIRVLGQEPTVGLRRGAPRALPGRRRARS